MLSLVQSRQHQTSSTVFVACSRKSQTYPVRDTVLCAEALHIKLPIQDTSNPIGLDNAAG
jgi:hypothetical protein